MIYRQSFTISPSDDDDLEVAVFGLYVGSAGDVKIQLVRDDDPVVLKAVPAGTMLSMLIKKVYDTGTEAGDLIGFK